MNLPAALYAIRWLTRDTFRQARASGLTWLMLAVSAVCIPRVSERERPR
jgi:hypothetical protein